AEDRHRLPVDYRHLPRQKLRQGLRHGEADGGLGHGWFPSHSASAATPLPTSPTRREMFHRGCGTVVQYPLSGTLPLVGRAGKGVSATYQVITSPPTHPPAPGTAPP